MLTNSVLVLSQEIGVCEEPRKEREGVQRENKRTACTTEPAIGRFAEVAISVDGIATIAAQSRLTGGRRWSAGSESDVDELLHTDRLWMDEHVQDVLFSLLTSSARIGHDLDRCKKAGAVVAAQVDAARCSMATICMNFVRWKGKTQMSMLTPFSAFASIPHSSFSIDALAVTIRQPRIFVSHRLALMLTGER